MSLLWLRTEKKPASRFRLLAPDPATETGDTPQSSREAPHAPEVFLLPEAGWRAWAVGLVTFVPFVYGQGFAPRDMAPVILALGLVFTVIAACRAYTWEGKQ